jgi:hypothetical protein
MHPPLEVDIHEDHRTMQADKRPCMGMGACMPMFGQAMATAWISLARKRWRHVRWTHWSWS